MSDVSVESYILWAINAVLTGLVIWLWRKIGKLDARMFILETEKRTWFKAIFGRDMYDERETNP